MEVRACNDTFQVCRGRKNKTRNHYSRELRFIRWSIGFRYRVALLAIITLSDEPTASIFGRTYCFHFRTNLLLPFSEEPTASIFNLTMWELRKEVLLNIDNHLSSYTVSQSTRDNLKLGRGTKNVAVGPSKKKSSKQWTFGILSGREW